MAGHRVLETCGQLGQLAFAADEAAGDQLRRRCLRHRGAIEPRILVQDRVLELAQPLARLDPELLGQRAAGVAIGLQRVGLAVAAVQGEHQLRPEALAIGVLGDQPLEPLEQLRVVAQRQFRLGQQFECRDAQVLQPRDLGLGERLEGQIRQRRPAPERQRSLERRRRPRRVARRELAAAFRHQALELVGVEPPGVEPELVAVLARRDHVSVSERSAQPRDVDLHGLGGRRWRSVAPELVDQPIAAERLVGVQQQHGQQRPLPSPAHRHHAVGVKDLEWAEDAEFDAQPRDRIAPRAASPARALLPR